MRKIRLVCVGDVKERYFNEAIEEYSRRLGRFCEFKIVEVPEYSAPNALDREAEAISRCLVGNCFLFDLNGRSVSSTQFAELIDKSFLSADTISFVIGGSNGLSQKLKSSVPNHVSFGKITFPHRLMRLIASEQIYRALTILSNLPYHK